MPWARFFRRSRRDDEAAREIASYIAIETDDNIARGLSPQAAHDAAVRKFGNTALVREEIYWMNTLRPVDAIWQDLRYAVRLLLRDKAFAAAAIISLALGIGANTAIFQLLDAVRLRVLPVERPAQLVEVRFAPGTPRVGAFTSRRPNLTSALFEEIRQRQRVFIGMFAWSSAQLNTADGGEVRRIEGLWASGGMFEVLGLKPALGRFFTADDDRPGCGSPGAVLSHAYWQREFGGAPSVLQQTVRLEGVRFDIIGVAPQEFFGLDVGRRFDVALPMCGDALTQQGPGRDRSRSNWWLAAIGRLAPGRTLEQAADHLAAMSPEITAATMPTDYTPEFEQKFVTNKLTALDASAGVSSIRTQFGKPLAVLLGATGLVLLIACANLANLLLARASAREREMAVRLAIGAGRRRLVSQLLVESVLLALVGTLLGIVVARALTTILIAQIASGFGTIFIDLSWNTQMFAFTTGVSVLACLLFGLAPALKATALSPAIALKTGGRGITMSRERFGLRRVLVVAQVALSLVLLIGALLFTRTLYNLISIDTGFDQDVVVAYLTHPSLGGDADRGRAMRDDIQQRIAALPGVASVAQADYVPLDGSFWNENAMVDSRSGPPGQKFIANFTRVGKGYFETLRVPIVRGRDFGPGDSRQSTPVAIVNQTFVRKAIGDADPLGRIVRLDTRPGTPAQTFEIIGVARDAKHTELRGDFEPLVVLAASQEPEAQGWVRFVIKPRGSLDGLVPAVAQRVGEVNSAVDIDFSMLNETIRGGLVSERLMAALSGAFGMLAGLLAAVGLYGVMSYTVARRSNEIGIRLALGSKRSTVLRLVLREAGVLVAIGLVVGTVLGLGLTKYARTLLFGLQPTDPVTIGAALTLLAVIGLGASYLPARRASRLDPVRVLRDE
jgi:putative ABC transport system permease protein